MLHCDQEVGVRGRDVEALAEAGLLERADEGTGVTAPFDAIETRIAL